MPTIEENFKKWNDTFDWQKEKPEWCESALTNDLFWQFSLFPRIQSFLPAKTILEIAPGHGRWTEFLKRHCETLLLVDLSPNCIEACKKRFVKNPHLKYFVNDGKSLEFIGEHSVDFVFSFDSLVHCEKEAIEAYLKELSTKLSPNGVGFIHHSNLAAHDTASMSPEEKALLSRGWRGRSMSAEIFSDACPENKLSCVTQERINWNSRWLIDCLSTFTPVGSVWERALQRFDNPNFLELRKLQKGLQPYVYSKF